MRKILLAVLFSLFLGGLPLLFAETIHWQVDKPVGGNRLGYVVQLTDQNGVPVSGGTSGDTHVIVSSMPSVTLADTHVIVTGPSSVTLTDTHNVSIMADVTLSSTITDTSLADTSTIVSFTLTAKCVAYECWLTSGNGFYFSDTSGGSSSAYMKMQAGVPYNTFGLGSEELYSGTVWV